MVGPESEPAEQHVAEACRVRQRPLPPSDRSGKTEALLELIVGLKHTPALPESQFFGGSLGVGKGLFRQLRRHRQSGLDRMLEPLLKPNRDKSLNQLVIDTHVSSGASRVPLPSASAEKLTVNPPGFMALGRNDMETAEVGNATA